VPSQPAESGVWDRVLRSPVRAFVLVFLPGVTIRGAVLVSGLLPPGSFRPFGEIGKVAVTLARTGQFANPYMIQTGATAHPTPVYTGLLALVYHTFGVTSAANYVRGLLAVLAFSALYAMLPWLGIQPGFGARRCLCLFSRFRWSITSSALWDTIAHPWRDGCFCSPASR